MELRSNRLICLADGHPKPEVRYFDAFENEINDSQGILIKSPGFYECEGKSYVNNMH